MSNIKYPFKSQDVSSTGFGVREKPESDHIPQVAKMVDVKPESDKNKYTMLPADPDGFIIFKPDFDTPCGEILAWVDDFSENAQKILSELNKLQERVKELEELLCTCCKVHGCPVDPECPKHGKPIIPKPTLAPEHHGVIRKEAIDE